MTKPALPLSLSIVEERVVFLGLASLSFATPFALGHSQMITGVLVNAALFASAILLPRRLFWPIILFPSLAVLSRGLIFGPMTPFLVYFLPFIWLGNLSLILIFEKTYNRFGFLFGALFASVGKSIFLFSFAKLFFNFHLVPHLFLTTMGVNQFLTALFGALLAFLFFKKVCHGKF